MIAYTTVHIQHNPDCKDSNGESASTKAYASKAKALSEFERFLRTSIVDRDYCYELDDPNIDIDFDNITDETVESVIRQAVRNEAVHFANCSVELRQVEVDEQE